MSRRTLHRREQHPVGQGLFHSATIRPAGLRAFNYIYDCGALGVAPRLDVEVDAVIARLAAYEEGLDAVFISHFHDDHFNGLQRLLNPSSGVKAKRIYLPFIDDVERAITLASSAGGLTPLGLAFLVGGPAGLTAALGIEGTEIVEVRPTGEGNDGAPEESPDLDDSPESALDVDLADVERFTLPAQPTDLMWESDETRGPSMELALGPSAQERPPASTAAKIVNDDQTIYIGTRSRALWEFRVHVDSAIRATKPAFVAALARDIRFTNHLDPGQAVEDWLAVSDNRRLLATDPALIAAARDAYVASVGNSRVNLTSMSLYSGPVRDSRVVSSWGQSPEEPTRRDSRAGISWLGTGDGRFRAKRLTDEVASHFGTARLQRVRTLVIPHHGGKRDFSRRLAAMFVRPYAVFSFGTPNNHGHPSDVAVDIARAAGMPCVFVTNEAPTRFVEDFWIELK